MTHVAEEIHLDAQASQQAEFQPDIGFIVAFGFDPRRRQRPLREAVRRSDPGKNITVARAVELLVHVIRQSRVHARDAERRAQFQQVDDTAVTQERLVRDDPCARHGRIEAVLVPVGHTAAPAVSSDGIDHVAVVVIVAGAGDIVTVHVRIVGSAVTGFVLAENQTPRHRMFSERTVVEHLGPHRRPHDRIGKEAVECQLGIVPLRNECQGSGIAVRIEDRRGIRIGVFA